MAPQSSILLTFFLRMTVQWQGLKFKAWFSIFYHNALHRDYYARPVFDIRHDASHRQRHCISLGVMAGGWTSGTQLYYHADGSPLGKTFLPHFQIQKILIFLPIFKYKKITLIISIFKYKKIITRKTTRFIIFFLEMFFLNDEPSRLSPALLHTWDANLEWFNNPVWYLCSLPGLMADRLHLL